MGMSGQHKSPVCRCGATHLIDATHHSDWSGGLVVFYPNAGLPETNRRPRPAQLSQLSEFPLQ